MDTKAQFGILLIPIEEWQQVKDSLQQLIAEVNTLQEKETETKISPDYISAAAYMNAVNIKKSKLYELISANKIKTLKKCHKLYVHASEVKRFFSDPSIQ